MATISKKKLSKQLSQQMDRLGFDRKGIRERIHVNNVFSKAKDMSTKRILSTDNTEKIFVGSMREGIGMMYCNDADILQINHAVICKQSGSWVNESGKVVFKMIQDGAPAGYTYLKLLSKDNNLEAFQNLEYACIRQTTGTFLSSTLFMTRNDDVFKSGVGIISKYTCYKPPKGPSIPKYVEPSYVAKYFLSQTNLRGKGMDFVRAFPCTDDSILDNWSKRERKCGWPSSKDVAHVKSLPAYLVPVGCKGDINADLQWRICFTMAEIYLVQDFNNVQTKVFVLMKLIAKHMLQPVCKCITSYAVKMVMLWLVENTPKKKFRKKHLLSRLADAIKHLKNAVENQYLPSYMIPERNLFAKNMSKYEQNLVVEKLYFLLRDGAESLQRYFCDGDGIHEDILHIQNQLSMSNYVCKLTTDSMALFTTEQLANYMTEMFLCHSPLYMHLHSFRFLCIPYYIRYGTNGIKDRRCYRLEYKPARSEKKEEKRLKQKKIANGPVGISTKDKSRISSDIVLSEVLLRYLKILPLILQWAFDIGGLYGYASAGASIHSVRNT